MAQRLKYMDLAADGMAGLQAAEHALNTASGLAPVLLELVRLRCSLLNGCEYCIAHHSQELRRHNEPAGRIADVAEWRGSDAYTQRERAALRWAEVVTDIQQGHAPDAEFTAMMEHFTDADAAYLTLAIAGINAWNRMAIALRPEWHGAREQAAPEPIADDGGKVEVEQ